MRIILLTVQFKPRNLCSPWPKHVLLIPRRCHRRMQHPLPALGPPTFMAYAGRWVPSVNSLDRLRRPLRPLHRLDPAHSHSSHSLASLRMRCSRELSPGQCLRQRAGRIEATDLVPAQQLPLGRVPISTPMCRTCAPSAGALARLMPHCVSNAPAGAWMFQSIMPKLSASEIGKADSCVGSGPAAGSDVSARHLLACAAGSE